MYSDNYKKMKKKRNLAYEERRSGAARAAAEKEKQLLELAKSALPMAMYLSCLKGTKLDGLTPQDAAAKMALNAAESVLAEIENRKLENSK